MPKVFFAVFSIKCPIFRKIDDPQVVSELSRVPYDIVRSENGSPSYNINYAGKSKQLSPEQLTAALFTKLKDIAENALGVKVNDVVISVPSYFTDAERRALMDSAK